MPQTSKARISTQHLWLSFTPRCRRSDSCSSRVQVAARTSPRSTNASSSGRRSTTSRARKEPRKVRQLPPPAQSCKSLIRICGSALIRRQRKGFQEEQPPAAAAGQRLHAGAGPRRQQSPRLYQGSQSAAEALAQPKAGCFHPRWLPRHCRAHHAEHPAWQSQEPARPLGHVAPNFSAADVRHDT